MSFIGSRDWMTISEWECYLEFVPRILALIAANFAEGVKRCLATTNYKLRGCLHKIRTNSYLRRALYKQLLQYCNSSSVQLNLSPAWLGLRVEARRPSLEAIYSFEEINFGVKIRFHKRLF